MKGATTAAMVAAGVLVGALLIYSRRDDPAGSASSAAPPASRNELEPRPRRAAPTPPAERREAVHAAPVEAAAAPPLPAPRSSLAETPDEEPSLAHDTEPGDGPADGELMQSYLRLLEVFRGEPRDPTASVAMEREILDRIAQQPGLALTSIDVECRTTTCRVRFSGPDVLDESRNISFETFGVAIGTTDLGADGSLTTQMLLSRAAAATP